MSSKNRRRGEPRRSLIIIILIICLIGLTVFVTLGLREVLDRKAGNDFYADAQAYFQQMENDGVVDFSIAVTPSPEPPAAPSASPGVRTDAAADSDGFGSGAVLSPTSTPFPVITPSAAPASMNFYSMKKKWPDIRGWIRIPDTVIDYPIVQGTDDIYYLNHLPDQSDSSLGAIMMTCMNAADLSDEVTTIHGHHLKSGKMFGSLEKYIEEAYMREHPAIEIFTPDGDYVCPVFACCYIDADTFSYPVAFFGEEDFDSFVAFLKSETPFDTGITPAYGTQLILLSTCAYVSDNARFIVAAVRGG